MHITAPVGVLNEALQAVNVAIDRSTSLDSSHVYLRAVSKDKQGWLYLYGTNMTSEVMTKIPVTLEEGGEGEALINPQQLRDGLQFVQPDQTIRLDNSKDPKWLKCSSGRIRYTLAVRSNTQAMGEHIRQRYPLKGQLAMRLPAALLREFHRRGQFCVFSGDSHTFSAIRGLKITQNQNQCQIWGTNSIIAVRANAQIKQQGSQLNLKQPLVLDSGDFSRLSILLAHKKAELIDMILADNWCYFVSGDTVYGTRPMIGSFPDIATLIDQAELGTRFAIDRVALLHASQRAASFSAKGRTVRLELRPAVEGTPDELTISCSGLLPDEIVDDLPIVFEDHGPTGSSKVFLDVDYLTNIAANGAAEQIQIGIAGHNKPLVIDEAFEQESHSIQIRYIIMGKRE